MVGKLECPSILRDLSRFFAAAATAGLATAEVYE
jgi:hypothetical protein